MIPVIGVRFRRAGKIYYFSPGDVDGLEVGASVVVETSRGMELGEIAEATKQVPEDEVVQPLKQVIRVASAYDMDQAEANHVDEEEAFGIAVEKIEKHDLEMKLVDVEYTFDRNKLVFYFTADKRVDFRELVKDLAARFRTRIELRQIGVRDEAKMLGGLGVCGRGLCCSGWMSEFEPVSIRQAKDQDLAMNPNKISGLCGRLKCCLRFEADAYEEAKAQLPKVGQRIVTPAGDGKVVAVNLLCKHVTVQCDEGPRVVMKDGQMAEKETAAGAGTSAPAGCANCSAHHGRQSGEPSDRKDESQSNEKARRRRRRPKAKNATANQNAGASNASEEIAAGRDEDHQQKRRKRKPRRRPRKRSKKQKGADNAAS